MRKWAIYDDVGDWGDFGNGDFCLYSLFLAWDQA
jgi:hypothetical protein